MLPPTPQGQQYDVCQVIRVSTWGQQAVGELSTLTHPAAHLLQRTLRCISRDQAGRPEVPFHKLMFTDKWPLCSGHLPMQTLACRPPCVSPCSCGGLQIGSLASPWNSNTCQTQVHSWEGSNGTVWLQSTKVRPGLDVRGCS